ncbi:MAG: hypothetical protein ACOY3X_04715 [Pseudomonadota bacterium]
MRRPLTLFLLCLTACLPVPAAAADDPCALSLREQLRIPGQMPRRQDGSECDPRRSPPPPLLQDQPLPALPDRWRIVDSLPGYGDQRLDPFRRNPLKGDRPLRDDWFLVLTGISDTVLEPRRLPTPVGPQGSGSSDLNVFGEGEQLLFSETLSLEVAWLRGDTVFRPPDIEFRFTPVLNINRSALDERRALDTDPRAGESRIDEHLGVQAAFVDFHLRNVSDRYDFDSVRIGIQPFNADFRGFLFQDAPFGVRLFGTRDNNIHQYNLAWFRRLEKDTNSGLNDIGSRLRNDDVLVGNYYWQDFLAPGFTVQGSLLYNRNRETSFFYDNNGFLNRPASLGTELPREYDVWYPGLSADGHVGRWNITASGYAALGRDTPSVFTRGSADIRAFFGATEFGFDNDWQRWRFSAVVASGDRDPFDGTGEGFDAVFENPVIAGADTSFWIRQGIPLIGGGGVTLSTRNGLLANLRSSKEHGQSNFVNPGLVLLGAGVDLDLTPQTRLSFNLNHLQFAATEVLETARQQAGLDADIGWDVSAAVIWRPLAIQNIVCRLSAAVLLPGGGYEQLFGDETGYSLLGNVVLTY